MESALEAHPSVRQAVAVGEPDERLGERVCAFVVCVPGALVRPRRRAGRGSTTEGLARFKTPERVVVLDALPLLAAGKTDRTALRRRATNRESG